jgi:PTH1 family peptidyl-tRNA hydrolase
MNDSGRAVQAIRHFYKIEAKDVWVACDDIDLPVGMIRVRLEGSSGGHNGLKSIIEALSTEQFARVRLGIGQTTGQNQKEFENYISEDRNSAERSSHQPSVEAKQFVLSPFGEREAEIVKKAIEKAAEIIIDALGKKEGLEGHTYEVG